MKALLNILAVFTLIATLFKLKGVFIKYISGRERDPAHPEKGRFTKEDALNVMKAVIKESRQLQRTMPKVENPNSKFMMRGALGTVAIYRGMRNYGIGHEHVKTLGCDIAGDFYKLQTAPLKIIGHLFARNPAKQMDLIQRLAIKYFLTSPDWDVVVCDPPSGLKYHVHRCPSLDYAKTFGPEAEEFFVRTNCTLDWPWAESLVKGGYYEKTKCLGWGDEYCTMYWGAK